MQRYRGYEISLNPLTHSNHHQFTASIMTAPFRRLLRRFLFPPPGASSPANPTRLFASQFSSARAVPREGELRRSVRFSKGNAVRAIEEWVGRGGKVASADLRGIVADLRHAGRYRHALDILSWKDSSGNFHLSLSDHATKLDLIARFYGTAKAEEYFSKLDNAMSKKAASFALLHHFVRIRDLEKAEALMADLQSQGLVLDQHLYDEMMKLYIAKLDFRKVFLVIEFMKMNQIPLTVLSYNLWMNASIEFYGKISSVEKILEEMTKDRSVEVGWSTYVTLANIYMKYELHDKALAALVLSEGKLSARKRLGYSFVMTCYASLKNKKGVMRLWEMSKQVPSRITCADYICVMGCLVKMGDLIETERLFRAWESEKRKYDIRVPNILLGGYVRNGLMERAEKFHLYTLQKGAVPNYKTYEILMEGWVMKQEMDKAVDAMKKGFVLLRTCKWRPSLNIVHMFARYFENQGNVVEFTSLVKVLRNLDLMSLTLYKSLLRTYINANVAPSSIMLDMIKGGIELDEEIEELIMRAKRMDSPGNA